jgi:hypothetical protein
MKHTQRQIDQRVQASREQAIIRYVYWSYVSWKRG